MMSRAKNGCDLGKIAGTRLVLVEESGDTLEDGRGEEYRQSRYVVVPRWPTRSVGWVGVDLSRVIVSAVAARWGGSAVVTLDDPPRMVQRRCWGRTAPAVEAYVRVEPR